MLTPPIPEPILLTDRTTIETDWDCGMKRWWYKEHDGTGIVPAQEASYFKQGRDLHEDLARIAGGCSLEEAMSEAQQAINELCSIDGAGPENDEEGDVAIFRQSQPALYATQRDLEPLYRRLGWVIAFHQFIWPKLLLDYEPVFIEREQVFQRDPLWVGNIPDLILRHRQTRKLKYVEYKTARSISDKWVNYWPYAVQIHLGIQAASEDIGEPIDHGQVLGLVKGYESYGRLHHPYVWGYVDKMGNWTARYRSGLSPAPLWDAPFDLRSWVLGLGEATALEQFIWSAPIKVDMRLLDELTARRTERERQVREVREACQTDKLKRAMFFEQRFTKCRPSFGDSCPYRAACHNATVNDDPQRSGLYVPRTPHHELELIGEVES